jgi:hypothetical protein
MSTTQLVELTPEQERFAEEHGATLCLNNREDATACVYRETFDKTIRWIVDRDGRILERQEFDRV